MNMDGYDCAYCPLGGVGEPVTVDGHPAHPDCAAAIADFTPAELAECREASKPYPEAPAGMKMVLDPMNAAEPLQWAHDGVTIASGEARCTQHGVFARGSQNLEKAVTFHIADGHAKVRG